MRLNHGMIALMLSTTALASPLTGCADDGLLYDPYGDDYHQWNYHEDRFYRQWELSTHRNHMDFRRRGAGDQRA
jgi:hypothetical protein